MYRFRLGAAARVGYAMLIVLVGVLLLGLAVRIWATGASSQINGGDSVFITPDADVQSHKQTLDQVIRTIAGLFDEEELPTSHAVEPTLPPVLSGSGEDIASQGMQITIEAISAQPATHSYVLGGQPLVLVYHTHTHEAYTMSAMSTYQEKGGRWRTDNNAYNIVRVGEELAGELYNTYGISVLLDSTDHETPELGTAYARSQKTIEKYLQQYPSIQLVIDVHRDAWSQRNTPQSITVNGRSIARLMFVVGNGEGSAGKGFEQMPNYEQNLALAQQVSDRLALVDPLLPRSVLTKTGRYNQHLGSAALLVEVGHNINTLEEALGSVPYLAQAIAQTLDRWTFP